MISYRKEEKMKKEILIALVVGLLGSASIYFRRDAVIRLFC